jgi:hypothetical protein
MKKERRERERERSEWHIWRIQVHTDFSPPKFLLALLVLKKKTIIIMIKIVITRIHSHRFFSFLRSFLLFLSFFSFLSCERRGAERNEKNK